MDDQNAIENIKKSPFLTTKLYVPRSNSKQIVRNALIEKLNSFHDYKMTLVSAPAGYGKTTLLSQWVTQCDDPVAWLSLDENDNEPSVFLQYLIAALQAIDENIGVSAANLLKTEREQPFPTILISLLNDISTRKDRLSIVLDDYHCIQSHEDHEILRYIVDHMPYQLHLILSTRSDPPLPLARMRARNNLSEIRISELCFEWNDIELFLNDSMGLNLSEHEITSLEHRTEGWAAGVQLAALSLKGCENSNAFIKEFSGDNRYVVDYLVEEVLNKQDEQTQDFLKKTSCLRQISADLCNYVLGLDNSRSILKDLEQQNLFVISLDSKRNWFRYHHLFADLLYQRLTRSENVDVSQLRVKASRWHEINGYLDEAIDYAIAAEDTDRAGELINMFSEAVWEHGKRTKLFHWFTKLPVDYIRNNLDLTFLHAWVLFENGQVVEAEQSLLNAEQVLESSGNSVNDTAEIRGKIKAVRALMATGQGDAQRIIDYANEALEYLPAHSSKWRAIACFSLGLAHSIDGDNSYAIEVLSQAREDSRASGNMDLYFRASYWLIGRLKYAGKLQEAIDTGQELLRYAESRGLQNTLVWGGACVFLGDLLYERNQLDEAYRLITEEIEMIERGHDVGRKGWGYYCLMRLLAAKGDYDGVREIIDKVEKLKGSTYLPGWVTQLTESMKAQMWLRQEDFHKVEEWFDQNQISVTGAILSLQYLGYMLLARYLLTRGRHDEASGVLDRLITKQHKTGRILLLIETLLIKAVALNRTGDAEGAVLACTEALHLAEKGGYVRVFLNEGQPVAELLEKTFESEVDYPHLFAKKLQTAFLVNSATQEEITPVESGEGLSERELEVLRLIAVGLPNKTIAEKLFISLSTVKTHLRNIFSKLNAHNRTEAVAKANEMHLL